MPMYGLFNLADINRIQSKLWKWNKIKKLNSIRYETKKKLKLKRNAMHYAFMVRNHDDSIGAFPIVLVLNAFGPLKEEKKNKTLCTWCCTRVCMDLYLTVTNSQVCVCALPIVTFRFFVAIFLYQEGILCKRNGKNEIFSCIFNRCAMLIQSPYCKSILRLCKHKHISWPPTNFLRFYCKIDFLLLVLLVFFLVTDKAISFIYCKQICTNWFVWSLFFSRNKSVFLFNLRELNVCAC